MLLDAVKDSIDKGKRTKMDDWATRYPTNTTDVARVLIDLAGALIVFSVAPPKNRPDHRTLQCFRKGKVYLLSFIIQLKNP